jgi:hypothetical protein
MAKAPPPTPEEIEGRLLALLDRRKYAEVRAQLGFSQNPTVARMFAGDGALSFTTKMSEKCAATGQLSATRYLHEGLRYPTPWDALTMAAAAGSGSLPLVTYLHARGCSWCPAATINAAMGGHMAVLVFALGHGASWDAFTCAKAAWAGQLGAVRYLTGLRRGRGSSEVFEWAASGGHMGVLVYLHESGYPWSADTCRNAVHGGRLAALQYLIEQGCPHDSWTCVRAVSEKHMAICEWLDTEPRHCRCRCAAMGISHVDAVLRREYDLFPRDPATGEPRAI